MTVQTCTFTISFPANNRVRESLFKLEDHFSGFQKPFTLVPLPADAPMELPRIVANSVHGHSQITICGNSAQLSTRFDEAYNHDVKKCIDYVRTKCKAILEAVSLLEGKSKNEPKFYFSGITTILALDKSDGIENPVDYISNKFIKCSTNLPIDEAQFRCALVVDGKYYANVLLQNSRTFLGAPDERGSFAGLSVSNEELQVVLDVNDRYAFNHEANYYSSSDMVAGIADVVEDFAENYVIPFVKEGVLNYGDK